MSFNFQEDKDGKTIDIYGEYDDDSEATIVSMKQEIILLKKAKADTENDNQILREKIAALEKQLCDKKKIELKVGILERRLKDYEESAIIEEDFDVLKGK